MSEDQIERLISALEEIQKTLLIVASKIDDVAKYTG